MPLSFIIKGFGAIIKNLACFFMKMEPKLTASLIKAHFKMKPHPEGGWYYRNYVADESIPAQGLPHRFGGPRPICTGIYFLLEKGSFSAFHRIKSDEIWHFYAGGELLLHIISPAGELETVVLGTEFMSGRHLQWVVPAGYWFAAEPAPETEFSLVGCTVAPGFDFNDFELAKKNSLAKDFPQHQEIIKRLCKD